MKFLLISFSFALLLMGCSQEQSDNARVKKDLKEEVPLLPFETFFTPNRYKSVLISPDGQWISYVANIEGNDNLLIAPVANPQESKQISQVTNGNLRPSDVSGNTIYRWSRDSKHLIYMVDYDGNEAFDLWVADIATGENRQMTKDAELKTQIAQMSDAQPDVILISEMKMTMPFPEYFTLNIKTGEKTPHFPSRMGVYGYLFDYTYTPRMNLAMAPQTGGFKVEHNVDGNWPVMHEVKREDRGNFLTNFYSNIIHMDADNKHLYAVTSEDRNTSGLFKWNLETGEKELVAENERTDIGKVVYNQTTNHPIAYSSNWARTTWHAIEPGLQADLDIMMQHQPASDVWIESLSKDNKLWVLRLAGPDNPTTYYLYDRNSKKMNKLFSAAPQYEEMALAPMYPYEMTSPDGYKYVSYYTLPPGSDSDSDGIPDQPMPSLMLVHGGPSDERAVYAFGGLLQWFSNRGYATFYVNFRGSPGFGKEFMSASYGEWGGKMHQDLLDQVDWAVAKGIADKNRFGILGGSYGGYATLVGATMTPDVFACAVPIVGPSTLEVFMPHWNVDDFSKILGGDPRTEEGLKFLASRSPVNFAHQTKNPVLVIQGATDTRVPQSQSDLIVEKMVKTGADVTYLLYPDEGHGIVKPHNTKSMWGITEQFLANCLGGRAEPLGDKLQGSTVQIPVGADKIAGLKEPLVDTSE